MTTLRFTVSLSAPAATVWAHATSPAGINRELAPLMKMSFPQDVETMTEETVKPGERICSSWFLLFGVLPIDRAEVTLSEIGPGYRFVEQSPLLSMRLWRHTRTITESDNGCVLEDVLEFEPRTPILSGVARSMIRTIFKHRHARLRALFG